MAKPSAAKSGSPSVEKQKRGLSGESPVRTRFRSSMLVDTRVIHRGDSLERFKKLRGARADLIYVYPPFESSRNHALWNF